MNVSLTPKLEKWIQGKVAGGKYQTASEVVREALRLCMENDEKLRDMRKLVQEGLDDIKAGRVVGWDPDRFKADMEERIDVAKGRKLKRAG